MKKVINYGALIIGLVYVTMIMYACKKFVDKQPTGSLSQTQLYNKTGIEGLLIGTYHALGGDVNWGSAPSNWVFGSVLADEGYKGSINSDQPDIIPLETWAYNANNPYLNEKWVNAYRGIGRANETIRTVPLASDLTEDDQKRIIGEARFLRGHFHFDLKKIFNNVPYVDESITAANGNTNASNVDASGNFIDIWPNIEEDFKFAMDNLPGKLDEKGRANKWAAASYLAKTYLFEHKYAEAKTILDQIIANGTTTAGNKYELVNYFSNFNPAQDNSNESIFAYQSTVNDGSGTNGDYGDNLNYPNSGGPGGCCGFFNPTITLANAYKTDANGLPLLDTYNAGNNVSSPANPYTGTLDPRIDLVMGRPGVPYLDYGPYPVEKWVRDPPNDGYFSPKKTVYAKSQTSIVSNENSFWGPTQMDAGNVNIIRYADVLLWAAECEVEVGSTALAATYVNQVRQRAADPKGWVYKSSDYDAASGKYLTQTTPADNYKLGFYTPAQFGDQNFARKAVMFERFLELAQEGHRFFDLRRQDNGTGLMANTLNAYATAEKTRPGFYATQKGAQFEKDKDEYLPLPQSQVDQANSFGTIVLKQNQ